MIGVDKRTNPKGSVKNVVVTYSVNGNNDLNSQSPTSLQSSTWRRRTNGKLGMDSCEEKGENNEEFHTLLVVYLDLTTPSFKYLMATRW
jgi:hypothetical protein